MSYANSQHHLCFTDYQKTRNFKDLHTIISGRRRVFEYIEIVNILNVSLLITLNCLVFKKNIIDNFYFNLLKNCDKKCMVPEEIKNSNLLIGETCDTA